MLDHNILAEYLKVLDESWKNNFDPTDPLAQQVALKLMRLKAENEYGTTYQTFLSKLNRVLTQFYDDIDNMMPGESRVWLADVYDQEFRSKLMTRAYNRNTRPLKTTNTRFEMFQNVSGLQVSCYERPK